MRNPYDLLFGPRQPRPASNDLLRRLIKQGSWPEAYRLIKTLPDPDSHYDLLLIALIEDRAREQQSITLWTFAALGLIKDEAETVICQNDPTSGPGCCNWNRLTKLHLIEKEQSQTVCGRSFEGDSDGGRAQRGAWREAIQQRCTHCLSAAYRFPETLEQLSDNPFLDKRAAYRVINPHEAQLRFIDEPEFIVFEHEGAILARQALAISAADWLESNLDRWRQRIDAGPIQPHRGEIIEIVNAGLEYPDADHLARLRERLVSKTLG